MVDTPDGNGLTASIAVVVSFADVYETTTSDDRGSDGARSCDYGGAAAISVTECFTQLAALSAIVEYAGAWNDAEYKARYQNKEKKCAAGHFSSLTGLAHTVTGLQLDDRATAGGVANLSSLQKLVISNSPEIPFDLCRLGIREDADVQR